MRLSCIAYSPTEYCACSKSKQFILSVSIPRYTLCTWVTQVSVTTAALGFQHGSMARTQTPNFILGNSRIWVGGMGSNFCVLCVRNSPIVMLKSCCCYRQQSLLPVMILDMKFWSFSACWWRSSWWSSSSLSHYITNLMLAITNIKCNVKHICPQIWSRVQSHHLDWKTFYHFFTCKMLLSLSCRGLK